MGRNAPFVGIAGVAMIGFIVWLFAQMTRTPQATRTALILGGCAVALAVVGGVLALLQRRRQD